MAEDQVFALSDWAVKSIRERMAILKGVASDRIVVDKEQGVITIMAESKKTVNDVIEVVKHGDALVIPKSLPLDRAIRVLQQKQQEEETFMDFNGSVNVTPYDGAFAMSKALKELFGVTIATKTAKSGFMGMVTYDPPEQVTIEINAQGDTVQVPWGSFVVPGMEGTIEATYTQERGMVIFSIHANIKGKYREQFERLLLLTKKYAQEESIYRGKALSVEFTTANPRGGRMAHPVPEIKFMNVSKATRPIFSAEIEDQFEHDVLTYVRQRDAVKKLQGGVLKRGVLFAGPYGTGKTLASNYIAKVGEENGFTFIYTTADDVPFALDFAKQYLPAIVFAEDIEGVVGSERTDVVNTMLNKLDGVDSKKHDIITIFTTNHVGLMNAAMLRPGRIDILIPVMPPDAEAAVRVARLYAGDAGMAAGDYTEAGEELANANMIPAQIQEAVKRAQIRALSRSNGRSAQINSDDLRGAAVSIRREANAVNPKDTHTLSVAEVVSQGLGALGSGLGASLGKELGGAISDIAASRVITGAQQNLLAQAASEVVTNHVEAKN